MSQSFYSRGMTLVEVLLVVTIIALLAAVIVPPVLFALRSRENARAACKMRAAVEAFALYAADTSGYPQDKYPGEIPPEMADYYFPYFKIDWWGDDTDLGGRWDWDSGYHFKYSVSISGPTKSQEQMTEFDRMIDDGDLNGGSFRKVGSQYHYIIEE